MSKKEMYLFKDEILNKLRELETKFLMKYQGRIPILI